MRRGVYSIIIIYVLSVDDIIIMYVLLNVALFCYFDAVSF